MDTYWISVIAVGAVRGNVFLNIERLWNKCIGGGEGGGGGS